MFSVFCDPTQSRWVCLSLLAIVVLMAFAQGVHAQSGGGEAGPAEDQAEWVDVRHLGAKGDGVTDDTDAIQRAIDRAGRHGDTVFFPAGRYRITRTLRVTGNHPSNEAEGMNWIKLVGVGEGSCLLGDGVDYILAAADLRDDEGKRLYISGLKVDGLSFSSYDTAEDKRSGGIDASYLTHWFCQNSYFIRLRTGIFSAARDPETGEGTPVWIIRILNNTFSNCHDYAIKMGRIFDMVIDNNIIEHGRGGIAIGEPGDGWDAAANTIRITNNVIEGLHAYGRPAILGSCWVGGRIVGNYFEENHAGDIVLTPAEKDGWTRGLVINANTFQPTAKQRDSGAYGPIHLSKTMDALITGNFTTGATLIHPHSGPIGADVNIASNVLNNPPQIGAVEGAAAGDASDYQGQLVSRVGRERWQVSSPLATVSLDALGGFQYKPRGEQTRSIAYGDAPPSGEHVEHQPGDLVVNLTPRVEAGKILFGWMCVEAGSPGQWKPLWMVTQ